MRSNLLTAGLIVLSASGCAGSTKVPAASAPSSAGSEQAPKFGDQVARGKALYAARCAACHGENGEGRGRLPALVGLRDGALPLDPPAAARRRKTQFKTAADLADFVVHAMPASAPGSLAADEYWAILAFDLDANGVDTGGKPLDAALASTLTIPR
jgi:cytochrome c